MGRGSREGMRSRTTTVAAVLAVALAGCGSTAGSAPGAPAPAAPDRTGEPVVAGRPAVDPVTVAPCPRWDAAPTYPDGSLPPDAVSIRVCPGDAPVSGPPQWRAPVAAPVDALTTGVPALIDALDVAPPWEGLAPGEICSQEGRPRVHYVVGYADGSTQSVTTGYGDCGLVELGEPGDEAGAGAAEGVVAREDGAGFAAAVASALAAQRHDMRSPLAERAAPRCVPNTRPVTALPVRDLELAVAAVCVSTRRGWRRAVVPAALVEDLSAALAADAGTGPSTDDEACPTAYVGKVVGWSTWADPVEVQLHEGCVVLGAASSPADDTVTPPPDLLADLLALPLGPPVPQR